MWALGSEHLGNTGPWSVETLVQGTLPRCPRSPRSCPAWSSCSSGCALESRGRGSQIAPAGGAAAGEGTQLVRSPAAGGDTAGVQQGMEKVRPAGGYNEAGEEIQLVVSPAGGYNTAGDQLEMLLVRSPAGGYCCAAGGYCCAAGEVMDDGGDQELMDGSGCGGGAGAWQCYA